jgi:hypothetical protein
MQHYHVDYIETERRVTSYVNKELFEFRKDKKHHWLQKLCFWVLSKIGSHSIGEKVSYTQHRIDTPNFMEKLYRQKHGLLDLYNAEGERLLIGNDEYMELTGNPEIRHMMHFTGEYRGRHGELLGMKITVIPWMSGILVVPRDAA